MRAFLNVVPSEFLPAFPFGSCRPHQHFIISTAKKDCQHDEAPLIPFRNTTAR
jgi:hypothetical protein